MDDVSTNIQNRPLVLLGVGASAGGLEAFQSLLGALRPDDDFALILVQHLDPEHESLLPELLAKRTRLPVVPIEDGTAVERGHVYLIPPAYSLEIEGTTLKLVEFETPRGLRRPIDTFFEGLAREHGENAAGVILSGTGSDGSQGVRALKEAGGLVFAQDPHHAKYDGMPRSAIATGAVDMVLPASDMISVLRDFHDRAVDITPALESDASFIEKVVRNVRYRTGHDFSGYKFNTVLRRITLRMSVLGLEAPADYLRELVQNRGEAEKLFRDLLINVTSFFRDRDVFAALQRDVVATLLEGKDADDEVRIWVPGCSTGQEAYTVAILFADEMARMDVRPQVSVFGTDIDDEALAVARRGVYPNAISSELPQHLLDRYFTATRNGFEVKSELRDMVRFSAQSLIKDPPFSKLDLVTCRNVLIYFDHQLQELALRVFHYALRPGGYLMLGPSESARIEQDGFIEIPGDNRIFRRNNEPARSLDLPRSFPTDLKPRTAPVPKAEEALGLPLTAAEALFNRHVPPFLLIGAGDEILQVGPGAERYIRLPSGKTTLGARALVLPPLEPALKRVLTGLALSDGQYRQIELADPGADLPPGITLGAQLLDDGSRIVTIQTSSKAADEPTDPGTHVVIDESYVNQLEDELEEARRVIRTTVEELETSNEELKSSNEEMMSMNEELQSANEELSTTNEELQNKLRELAEVNADLANFMESTQIATVFLDGELRVRNFTPEAVAYFRFVEQDRGRELMDIGSRLDMNELALSCKAVLETGLPQDASMTTSDGNAEVQIRFAPYRAEGADAGGIVFSIFDVTKMTRYARELEEANRAARASAEEIEELYRVTPGAIGLVDSDMRYIRANPRLAEINGVPSEDHIGKTIAEIVPDIAGATIPAARQVFDTGEPLLGMRIRGTTAASEEERVWEVDWYPVSAEGQVKAVGFNVNDITHLLELQADLRRIMRELQHRVKNMLSNVIALVNRARRESGDPQIVLDTLSQRIHALANTHGLLTSENWSSTALRDIFHLELTNVYGADRVELRGPVMRLNARATLAVGMAIHELATNAAKYGAFSVPEGRVSIRWSRVDEGDGDKFILRWQETGGPVVSEPGADGFGSQLIRSVLEGTLEGEVVQNWEPSGLGVVVTMPWAIATEVDYETDMDPLRDADPLP